MSTYGSFEQQQHEATATMTNNQTNNNENIEEETVVTFHVQPNEESTSTNQQDKGVKKENNTQHSNIDTQSVHDSLITSFQNPTTVLQLQDLVTECESRISAVAHSLDIVSAHHSDQKDALALTTQAHHLPFRSTRHKLAHFLEGTKVNIALMILIALDAVIVFIELLYLDGALHNHDIEHGLHIASLTILSIFALETLLLLFALNRHFFKVTHSMQSQCYTVS